MDKTIQEKIQSCSGNDGCAPDLNDGKAIVDKVRQVGVGNGYLETPHQVDCSCGETFTMVQFETSCPSCDMTYGVTPCSSHDPSSIKAAGIKY
ncbi:hypothetical protein [Candidatus Xianfuyuplasma coldseepsis]|uniref:hypothetical protein n=1 Tax=Candidatus Xianfuyuplasma coldseepsis TaxID=2782163 RepID=UPI0021623EF2|nr:hypothetical protein [Xianfuyuplasma coldseepsis]